jgi:hypothetical protein
MLKNLQNLHNFLRLFTFRFEKQQRIICKKEVRNSWCIPADPELLHFASVNFLLQNS